MAPRIDPEHYPVQEEEREVTFEITAQRLQQRQMRKKVVPVPWILSLLDVVEAAARWPTTDS